MTRALSWEQLDAIERQHGDAFYLIDLEAFRGCSHELRDAFRGYYRNTQLAYSYKTNYMPRFCRLVNDWGGYAEVVSRMEYEMALRAGVAAERIIFNGPYKSPADLKTEEGVCGIARSPSVALGGILLPSSGIESILMTHFLVYEALLLSAAARNIRQGACPSQASTSLCSAEYMDTWDANTHDSHGLRLRH